MSTKDSRPKITYNGIVKKLVEEAEKKDNCEVTIAFTGIMHTGEEAVELAKKMLAVRPSIAHQCIDVESSEAVTRSRNFGLSWGEYSAKGKDLGTPDPGDLVLDMSTMAVYFLDEAGLLRFIGVDQIPYYVYIDDKDEPRHIHPSTVYIPEEGEVVNEAPEGYMFIASPGNVSKEAKERNKYFRNKLNGGAN